MDFHKYLTELATKDGSDLYLSTGATPSAKFQGEMVSLSDEKIGVGELEIVAREIMDDQQWEQFGQDLEMNLAISIARVGRFRVNIFKQRNQFALVARNIKSDIPKISDLGLPEHLKDVVMSQRGLILFVGATGSGKSTSLAALLDYRNENAGGHIITIEDPIEFIHRHKKSIVNQREVGVDTRSFHSALINTLRQAPDVILIGEIRDRETMEHCLAFSETGHLAISTLHANNANQALDRIINFFPEQKRAQLLSDLSLNIKAIVSQRLVKTIDGKRTAAIEILLNTSTIRELILKGDVESIKEIMAKSENLGMQTFDSSLYKLVKSGKISESEALRHADSVNNLRLRLKLEDMDEAHAAAPEPVSEAQESEEKPPTSGPSTSRFELL
ncbi:MAG: PilT/PilU family type 4a pilus ATPase [Oceanospirillaceae bacterium]|nr:PilT/PilU family type 4a pilus ATPase [Oceanospirillaceae bacterium]